MGSFLWRHLFRLCVLFIGMPFCWSENPKLEFDQQTTSNNYFHLVGVDTPSVMTATRIAQEMGELGADYFALPNSLQPISVELQPSAMTKLKKPFVVRLQAGGRVVVIIKWDEFTTFQDTCQALASGFLTRAAFYAFGPEAASNVPDWLELAFASALEVRLRPANIDALTRVTLLAEPLRLEMVVNAKSPFPEGIENVSLHAYWLFKYLESELDTKEAFSSLLARFIGNQDYMRILNQAFPQRFKEKRDVELWWAVGLNNMLQTREPPFLGMDDSRRRVAELVSLIVNDGVSDVRLRVDELWAQRDIAALQVEVGFRLREIKLELQRINRLYYNSLLSLGNAFESFADADEASFKEYLKVFQHDYEIAQNQELEIRRLLRY